jgi:predicted transcriptional regulator
MDKRRLQRIEKYVLDFFRVQQHTRILAKELFASTSAYANADIVRALEDLEKKERLLVRHTTEGNDYVSLTTEGATLLGLQPVGSDGDSPALPHPPKSATKTM